MKAARDSVRLVVSAMVWLRGKLAGAGLTCENAWSESDHMEGGSPSSRRCSRDCDSHGDAHDGDGDSNGLGGVIVGPLDDGIDMFLEPGHELPDGGENNLERNLNDTE